MRVVIVDDSGIVRQGLVRLLVDEGIDVVADVGNAEDLIVAVETVGPDVAIVDIRMPPTHTNEGSSPPITSAVSGQPPGR